MTLNDFIGRIWSEITAKYRQAQQCITCLPKLYRDYKYFRSQKFTRKAALFCARNTVN